MTVRNNRLLLQMGGRTVPVFENTLISKNGQNW